MKHDHSEDPEFYGLLQRATEGMSAEDPWRSTAYNIFPSFIMDSFPGHCG